MAAGDYEAAVDHIHRSNPPPPRTQSNPPMTPTPAFWLTVQGLWLESRKRASGIVLPSFARGAGATLISVRMGDWRAPAPPGGPATAPFSALPTPPAAGTLTRWSPRRRGLPRPPAGEGPRRASPPTPSSAWPPASARSATPRPRGRGCVRGVRDFL